MSQTQNSLNCWSFCLSQYICVFAIEMTLVGEWIEWCWWLFRKWNNRKKQPFFSTQTDKMWKFCSTDKKFATGQSILKKQQNYFNHVLMNTSNGNNIINHHMHLKVFQRLTDKIALQTHKLGYHPKRNERQTFI
jgi:hypothetical protein